MKLKQTIFCLLLALFSFNSSAEINIKFMINDQIVTNIDIINEKNYLIFLRPELKKVSDDDLLKIAENSLIRETIKKRELDIVFKNLDNLMFIDEIKKNLFKFKNVNNESDFKILLKKDNVEYKKVLERIKYEALWSEYIYKKYNSLLRIDQKNLKKKLRVKISNNRKFEYNLSEILFEIDGKSSRENKFKEIIAYINNNSFKTAASKFSVSNSSNKGGEIGWVKETVLSDELNKILKKMQINEISKPIRHPNGFLLIKINNKRELKQNLNFDEELKDLINFEKSKQLNQYSLMHYKKLKQNSKINEY